ncbi:MAG: hypothetical protein ACK5JD_17415 [Mangrovibacterium sp.]
MWKEQLKQIENVEYYAIIGFFIFFILFILVTVHTLRMDKKRADSYGMLPLDSEGNNEVEQQKFTL